MAQIHELAPEARTRKTPAGEKAGGKNREKKRKKRRTQAERADRYKLYQQSVQDPRSDIEFFENVFEDRYARKPRLFREDFCGTALTACHWVRRHHDNRAWGIDLDPEPLAWGRKHNAHKLDADQRSRLELIEGDVLETKTDAADLIVAQNFSYCVFKTRHALRQYFEVARQGLNDQGLFVLDLFGGPDAQRMIRDRTELKRFTYIWDQKFYDAITNEILCHIHFNFPDGSKMKKAFTYDWRLWTATEIKELLLEAGFSRADAYWEGPGDDGTGDGVFTRKNSAENEDAWIAYIIGGR
ncbi:MAG: class I SAM-dependent methyltransferase [Myxococcota bacterium]